MISISGIKYQRELEELPFFNKSAAAILIGKQGKNLDKKIAQLTKKGYFLRLKKGHYTSSPFYEKTEKEGYGEYLANILRIPSYLSLEYVLSKEGIIPEAVFAFTSITPKSPRIFANFIGNFIYRSTKNELFLGYKGKAWQDKKIYLATRAKALFDFLYLKKLSQNLKKELEDLRLNLAHFQKADWGEFEKYCLIAKSCKMRLIFRALKGKTDVS